jgi:hypothetical protein
LGRIASTAQKNAPHPVGQQSCAQTQALMESGNI